MAWNKVDYRGFITYQEVESIYKETDLGVAIHVYNKNTDGQEGNLANTKLFEYMAIGKPVIVYGTGEPKKLVDEANAGVVCPNGEYEAFSETIRTMIHQKNLWKQWGKNGQNYIHENYTSKIIAQKVNSMFRELLN